MTDIHMVRGCEDVWRPPVGQRIVQPRTVLRPSQASGGNARARLERVAARAPEVMVKVTGRTRDSAHLRAHLDCISRNGQLELEGADGALITSRRDVAELADDWSATALGYEPRRKDSPIIHSVILSMPAGTSEIVVRDAARSFAADMFAGRHDYVFTLHTDTPRPHVHLAVCSRGHGGDRLNPKKADLELWRQTFAQALRDRGVEAEATPRRARGVTRKAERTPLRKIRDRQEAGDGRWRRSAAPLIARRRGRLPGPGRAHALGTADRGATASGAQPLPDAGPNARPIKRPGGSGVGSQGRSLRPEHARARYSAAGPGTRAARGERSTWPEWSRDRQGTRPVNARRSPCWRSREPNLPLPP
jgi:hypothetical protein